MSLEICPFEVKYELTAALTKAIQKLNGVTKPFEKFLVVVLAIGPT